MKKIRHYKKVYERKPGKRLWGLGIKLILALAIIVGVAGILLVFSFTRDLPRPEKFTELALSQPTRIYDKTGDVLLYEVFGEEKRDLISLQEAPEHLVQAIIAAEDAGFYSHFGISIKGTVRALLTNLGIRTPLLRLGGNKQGGSTISQQLVRSSFLTREKTVARKIKEAILTLELERRYSKDELLEFYLNQIPLGANAYGVGAASQLYFGKDPEELSLPESATLAAMIQAPTYYSPHGEHVSELLTRKNYILRRMAEEGFLSPDEAEEAKAEDLVFTEPSFPIKAPHFVLYVLDQLVDTYGERYLRESGLKVYTSLDWELQAAAEEAVARFAEGNKNLNAHNASLVAMNPQTGEILAMVGSRDWFGEAYPAGCTSGVDCLFDPKLNTATYHQGRQPGSAFKPFVYATAFAKGYDDSDTVIDEETNFGIWGDKEYIPKNYDERFRGEVTLRQALAQSLNVPSVKVLLDMAGLPESIETARELGITTLNKDPSFYGPSLVLGGGEVRLLDMVAAYGVFSTEGRRTPPLSIVRVEDAAGRTIAEYENTLIQVLAPSAAQLITSILSDNDARAPMFGFNSPLYFKGAQVAAKTGTTNDFRDAWTIGYTSHITAGVWVGNNDNTPMAKQPGVMFSTPMWHQFMETALQRNTP